MAEKAIKITAENIERLSNRFFNDGPGVPLAIGYYLVAGFGEDGDYDIINSATFNEKYILGEKLHSGGFYEAIRK